MYEELVKRLRNRANGTFEEKCEGCEFTEDFPPCAHCTIKAFNDAADAIEQLIHHANDWAKMADCWRKRYEEDVRHGRWTRIDYEPLGHDYICSECGRKNDRASQYCPMCGVKMDKDGDGE